MRSGLDLIEVRLPTPQIAKSYKRLNNFTSGKMPKTFKLFKVAKTSQSHPKKTESRNPVCQSKLLLKSGLFQKKSRTMSPRSTCLTMSREKKIKECLKNYQKGHKTLRYPTF